MATEPTEGDLSRRGFLAGGAAIAVGAAARSALAREGGRQPSPAAWRQLAQTISGPVLRADSFDLSKLVSPANLRYAANLPEAVALCRSAEDVAFAVTWCSENHVPLVVQAGGHSCAGYSMRKESLMINLLLMRSAKLENGSLTIAGGMRNQDLHAILQHNELALTHGPCPTVGAAGFLLGGGIGFDMRAHGLGCDHLTGSDIVTADGNIRAIGPQASGIESDLFWACRGAGGGNFGVHTSFTLRTFPAEPLTVFALTWTSGTRNAEKVAAALIPALEQAPTGLGTRVSLRAPHPLQREHGAGVVISLIGQFKGSAKALDDILAPAFAVARPPQAVIWAEAPYWLAQELLVQRDGATYFQERSVVLAPSQAAKATAHAFHHLLTWPGTSGSADLRFFQTGGKINDTDPKATAFVHRTSAWIMDVGLTWGALDPAHTVVLARDWQDRFHAAIRPFSTGGAYQNFADPSLSDWRQAYYGDNLDRLQDIKKRIDPGRLFDFAQAI